MSQSIQSSSGDAVKAAFQQGRRVGLATAALALGAVSFLNLFGMEKSLLAIALAVIAMRGVQPVATAIRRGRIAVVLASAHIVTIVVVLVVFQDRLRELLDLLYELS